jgi:shikimate dehydrogenase
MFEPEIPRPEVVPEVARYAVFGHPIAHSKSPFIHRRFAAEHHKAIDYRAIDAAPEAFAAALARFAAEGGRGANVTLPLKALAAAGSASLGEAARRTGVVNTLTRTAAGWQGDNTDGAGLVADIAERWRLDLRGRRVLVLGAGGAVAGVLFDLLEAGVDHLCIVNRTPERADALADRIGEPGRVSTAYWADLATLGAFDFVLNGTSAARHGERLDLPLSIVAPRALAYDMNYGAAAIDFLAWARAAGFADVHDGLGMLVEQAAEAFRIWHDVRPDTEPVYRELAASGG